MNLELDLLGFFLHMTWWWPVAHGVMLLSMEMKIVTQVEILDMAVCISHNAKRDNIWIHTYSKSMNPNSLPVAMDK